MEGSGEPKLGRLLVLTLCKSDSSGSYHHTTIPLPMSYEAAVDEAQQVFLPYIGRQQASDIVLKCAIKRANGTWAWGILRPTDWRSVIVRPDGDEVGVFLRQDSLDLPYEPNTESNILVAGNQTRRISTRTERKIMHLTLRTNYSVIYGTEESTIIKAPETYQACQAAAYSIFKGSLGNQTQDDVILLIGKVLKPTVDRSGPFNTVTTSNASWSVVTPEAYSLLLSRSDDRIDLWVSMPPP